VQDTVDTNQTFNRGEERGRKQVKKEGKERRGLQINGFIYG
jgi:hypothetical protein